MFKTALIILAILSITGLGWYYYHSSGNIVIDKKAATAKIETRLLIDNLATQMTLPTDEEPTIATVMNLEKLKNQPFFAKAKVGYRVIIYAKARKAILYDPFENKVIEVSGINLDERQ